MKLREFTKTKTIVERVVLATNEDDDTTTIYVDGKAYACYKGAFSEAAESTYYQMLKNAKNNGCTIS